MAEANRERLIRTSRTARTFERYEVYEAYESIKSFKWSMDAVFLSFGVLFKTIHQKEKKRGELYDLEVGLVSGSKPCFGQTKTLAPEAFNSLCSSIQWQDHQKRKKRNAPFGTPSG